MPVELVILAGGRSSRMGEDKLRLRHHGRLLAAEWIGRLAWPGEPLLVLPPGATPPTEFPPVRIAHDAVVDQGPLQGVLTAQQHRRDAWQLIVPIDMPLLDRPTLDWLTAQRGTDPAARLWMIERPLTADAGDPSGRNCAIEPFPLLIHGDLQPAVQRRLAEGRRSLQKLADEPGARRVRAPAGWSENLWLNLNRPSDLAHYLATLK
ncbi:MAG: molybdenum cofactor guanylyltransferase [Tepidisphaeraceae bacterium]